MARPIEYDKVAVLTSAMQLFWQKGYEPTSMKELVEATGLTTRSMYNIFGSKSGLFEACLNWYYEVGARDRYERLIREDGLMAIRHFIEALGERKTKNGCLYVNTASDRCNIEDDSIGIIDSYFENLEMIFKSKLEYAKENESFDCDPELLSKQLIVIIQGLSVFSKNVKDPIENKHVVDSFLKVLNI